MLALDESKFSEVATTGLIRHIKSTGTEVRVLHVVEPFPESLAEKLGSKHAPDFAAARMLQRQRAKELVAQGAEKLRSAGFKVTTLIKEGDASSVILDRAETWRADMIVVGSHGREGLDRVLIGSVSEAVARHARCSVEIVRARVARSVPDRGL